MTPTSGRKRSTRRSTAGQIEIAAALSGTMEATLDASVSTSGDGVGGAFATNVLRGGALAEAVQSTLTTQGTAGKVSVTAKTTESMTAVTKFTTETGANGMTVTASFNSMGWAPTNILFNAIDTLIGDPAVGFVPKPEGMTNG